MKLTITRNLILFSGLMLGYGCGAFEEEIRLEVQMFGVARAPETATGDRDPQFQTYTVQSITLTGPEGDIALLPEPADFKIVDRPQIILRRVSDDLKDKTFTSLSVAFSPVVTGGDNDESALNFTLTNPTLTLTTPLTIDKSKTYGFKIKALWANTIGNGAMTEPSLEFVVD